MQTTQYFNKGCEIMTNETKQASINSFYLTLVRLKYEDELRRESSLIQQATQIQVVFSFAIAFLYTALPVVLDELNPKCCFWNYKSIFIIQPGLRNTCTMAIQNENLSVVR